MSRDKQGFDGPEYGHEETLRLAAECGRALSGGALRVLVGSDRYQLGEGESVSLSVTVPSAGVRECLDRLARGMPGDRAQLQETMLIGLAALEPAAAERVLAPFGPAVEPFLAHKRTIDAVGQLNGSMLVQATLDHLAGADRSFAPLVGYLDHVVSNRGDNPRLGPHGGDRVRGIEALAGLDVWFVKQGATSAVACVRANTS